MKKEKYIKNAVLVAGFIGIVLNLSSCLLYEAGEKIFLDFVEESAK